MKCLLPVQPCVKITQEPFPLLLLTLIQTDTVEPEGRTTKRLQLITCRTLQKIKRNVLSVSHLASDVAAFESVYVSGNKWIVTSTGVWHRREAGKKSCGGLTHGLSWRAAYYKSCCSNSDVGREGSWMTCKRMTKSMWAGGRLGWECGGHEMQAALRFQYLFFYPGPLSTSLPMCLLT